MEKVTANSRNLDLLRSFAVMLVVGFHLAKFFNWQLKTLRVTDFGLLGVMLFFVHTTLVLMSSLEGQSADSCASLRSYALVVSGHSGEPVAQICPD